MSSRYLTLILLFHIFYFSAVNKINTQIDLLIKLSDKYHYIDNSKSYIYAQKACILADKNGTSRQKAEAYYYMARNLIFVSKYNECYLFIKKGMREQAVKNDKFLLALYKELKSIYYSRLYMFSQEMKENTEALKLINPNKNAESKLFVSRIYMWMADYYTETNKYDSAQIYISKSIKLVEEIPDTQYLSFNRIFRRKAYAYFYQSQIFIKKNNTKSALIFIDKSYNQAVSEQHLYLYSILEAYGDYYFLSEEYQNAINYYKKAVHNKKAFFRTSADINLKISRCYKAVNDDVNEKIYLKISSEQRRYDEKMSRINITQVTENILQGEIEKNQDDRDKNIRILLITIFSSIIFLIFIFYRLIKIKRKQNEIIENNKSLLRKNTKDLIEKDTKIDILQQKINDSISDLIHMIKNNSPHFWINFQVIFPDFTGKMLRINLNLKTSELTLSAYIFLGLTTKEIAQYTFKSIKTIENNRYNLRKKFNITPEKDLHIWIKEHIKN